MNELEGTLEEEDAFNCFEESRIVKKPRGDPGTLTGVCVNSVNQWIPRRNLSVAILRKILTVF